VQGDFRGPPTHFRLPINLRALLSNVGLSDDNLLGRGAGGHDTFLSDGQRSDCRERDRCLLQQSSPIFWVVCPLPRRTIQIRVRLEQQQKKRPVLVNPRMVDLAKLIDSWRTPSRILANLLGAKFPRPIGLGAGISFPARSVETARCAGSRRSDHGLGLGLLALDDELVERAKIRVGGCHQRVRISALTCHRLAVL
jgi:hypothetical protein